MNLSTFFNHKKYGFCFLLLSAFILSFTLISSDYKNSPSVLVKQDYEKNLDSLKASIIYWQAHLSGMDQKEVQAQFYQSRYFYKKIEWLVTYHFPATAQRLNAANLLEAEASRPNEPLYPTGFQVIEEVVFDESDFNRAAINDELHGIVFALNRLQTSKDELFLNPTNIFDALKLNFYRLITHGISGFDSPVALNSLPEAVSTLKSAQKAIAHFPSSDGISKTIADALEYAQRHQQSFDDFDRAVFISRYIHPVCEALVDFQNEQQIPFATSPPRAIRVNAATMFDSNAFDKNFYKPAYAHNYQEEILAPLGKQLFHDKMLSVNRNRSCATCHDPAKAFTDGMAKNESLLAGQSLLRNTPTLINAGLQPVQFYDSRVAFLEDQIHVVISSPDEMGSLFSEIVARINNDAAYKKSFSKNFKEKKISSLEIKMALAAYIRSLEALNSPFDQYMRGDVQAMSQEAINGFNLFMGKAKCGTCHFMPLFNGSVPPLFSKMESEVLGVPAQNNPHAPLDDDLGKYNVYGIAHQKYQFKTTTLRNIALTAPYMHNGVFTTLEEVVDFYDAGGGVGRGIEVENQTLPTDSLHLSVVEKKYLVQFLEALTDTVVSKTAVVN